MFPQRASYVRDATSERRRADTETVSRLSRRPDVTEERRRAAPSPTTVSVFATPAEFRAWLESHHDDAAEQWVGYYKKGVAKTSMTYRQSVDEALCFGWIDGITRRIDDEVYAVRFTPRRKRSSWSALNVARMRELMRAGRAQPAGIRSFEARSDA